VKPKSSDKLANGFEKSAAVGNIEKCSRCNVSNDLQPKGDEIFVGWQSFNSSLFNDWQVKRGKGISIGGQPEVFARRLILISSTPCNAAYSITLLKRY
jgi:hypothetical protein